MASPLHHAAAYGNPPCIELLLNAGSDVDSVDENGWTALHFAVSREKTQNVETLIRCAIVFVIHMYIHTYIYMHVFSRTASMFI